MVKAVLFDLDGTLWDRDGAVEALLETQHAEFAELTEVPRDAYLDRMLALDAHGLGDKRHAYEQVAGEFGLAPDIADRLLNDFWTRYSFFFEPFPEVISTLHSLRTRGIKLGIITNGNTAIQESKIAGLGLAPLMDMVLISEREGIRKPDSAIFVRALERLNLEATDVWFVGDHPDADVRGAREAGLTAVWRRSFGHAPDAHHTISCLDQLEALLPI